MFGVRWDGKRSPLTQAIDEFETAAQEHFQMGQVPLFGDIHRHWVKFLVASNIVFEKLAVAAKGAGKMQQWMGGENRARREDPLLQWIREARNSEVHTLAPSIEPVLGHLRLALKAGENWTTRTKIDFRLDGPKLRTFEEDVSQLDPSAVDIKGLTTKLLTVTNRGNVFPPPTHHLGQPLPDQTALTAGKLTLDYLANFLQRAAPHFPAIEQKP